jgi:16S rRNA (guanine527-N7)-methyltransferase
MEPTPTVTSPSAFPSNQPGSVQLDAEPGEIDASLDFALVEHCLGSAYPVIAQFGSLLTTTGIERGVLGPREKERIWTRHLLNCAALDLVIPRQGTILDLGSGAGLPGVVVAGLRPNQQVILLEPLLRRCNWLEYVVAELGLSNVLVRRGRAEEVRGQVSAQTVVCRAVASVTKLLPWASPLLEPQGQLLALKGETVAAEVAEVPAKFRKGWAWPPSITEVTLDQSFPCTTVLALTKSA